MKNKIIKIIIILLILIMAISAFKIYTIISEWNKDANTFNKLTEKIEKEGKYPFDDYPEMVGWIKVDGTKINYPVMLSPDKPEKYLRANVDLKYSTSGTPFMDYRCTPDSPNIIIYGHNMYSGAMFHDLAKFKQKEFLKNFNTFTFTNREYETFKYKIFAVIKLDAKEDEELYTVISNKDAEYYNYVNLLISHSMYSAGVNPDGEQIMCLSTCSYHTKEGRLMIAGVRE